MPKWSKQQNNWVNAIQWQPYLKTNYLLVFAYTKIHFLNTAGLTFENYWPYGGYCIFSLKSDATIRGIAIIVGWTITIKMDSQLWEGRAQFTSWMDGEWHSKTWKAVEKKRHSTPIMKWMLRGRRSCLRGGTAHDRVVKYGVIHKKMFYKSEEKMFWKMKMI